MNMSKLFGYSLLELMVTVTVAGVVLGFGVPSFMQLQRNNAMIAVANDFVSSLSIARSEAVKRQVPVTMCGSPNPTDAVPACGAGGNGGYIIFVDEDDGVLGDATDGNAVVDANELVLLQRDAPGDVINVFGNGGQYVSYALNGYLVPTAMGQGQPSTTVMLICDDRGNQDAGGRSSARVVQVAPTGRAQVLRTQADVAAAAAATGGACP